MIKKILAQLDDGPETVLKALSKFDNNGRGMTYSDFQKALEDVNIHMTKSDAKSAFKELDLNHNGYVTYDEFNTRMFGASGGRVRVKTVKTKANVTTLMQRLRSEIMIKIKTLRGSPSKVFYQFRMLGGASGDGMTVEHFIQVLLKWKIRAEQNIVYALFQSFCKGATVLTYEAFVTALMPDKVSMLATNDVANVNKVQYNNLTSGAVSFATRSRVNVTSRQQLRLEIIRQVKILGSNPAEAFKQLRILGGAGNNGMSFRNFSTAISKIAINVEQNLVRSFFQYLVKGSNLLTYDLFLTRLIGDETGRIKQLRIATGKRLEEFRRTKSPVSQVRRSARREIEGKKRLVLPRPKTNANYRRGNFNTALNAHLRRHRNLSKTRVNLERLRV